MGLIESIRSNRRRSRIGRLRRQIVEMEQRRETLSPDYDSFEIADLGLQISHKQEKLARLERTP